jgi:hypothetical protein
VRAPRAAMQAKEFHPGDRTRMHGSGKRMRVLQAGCRGRSLQGKEVNACSVVQGNETSSGTGTKKSAEAALCCH